MNSVSPQPNGTGSMTLKLVVYGRASLFSLHNNNSLVSQILRKPVGEGCCEIWVAGDYFAVKVCKIFRLVQVHRLHRSIEYRSIVHEIKVIISL